MYNVRLNIDSWATDTIWFCLNSERRTENKFTYYFVVASIPDSFYFFGIFHDIVEFIIIIAFGWKYMFLCLFSVSSSYEHNNKRNHTAHNKTMSQQVKRLLLFIKQCNGSEWLGQQESDTQQINFYTFLNILIFNVNKNNEKVQAKRTKWREKKHISSLFCYCFGHQHFLWFLPS